MMRTFTDTVSGLTLTEWTPLRRHANHCYFNVEGSWDDNKELVISVDTDQGATLSTLNIESGAIRHLHSAAITNHPTAASVAPLRKMAYFWNETGLAGVDLESGAMHQRYTLPDGFAGANTAVTCDEKYVVTIISGRGKRGDIKLATSDLVKTYEQEHDSRLIAIALDSDEVITLHQTGSNELGHANPSPTDPDLLTFCHEGPWLTTDQRIWGIRFSSPKPWPIVPRDPDWGVGHEFWFDDGVTIGYHARYKEGTWRHALGWSTADGSDTFQAEVSVPTHHAHAQQRDRYILDGTRESGDYLMVTGPDGNGGWLTPRILCKHNSSRWNQYCHVHQHVSHDKRTIWFASDQTDYSSVYSITMPEDLTTLPEYTEKPYRSYWE